MVFKYLSNETLSLISITNSKLLMMFVATFLMGMVGVTTALQNTWWSPQNNFVSRAKPIGTIDFRYPDWVVSPRPPCLSEGTFPHPRSSNCTWYYRCTARVGIPRFATFYFECEPGTMFDDDLDQCVHPHSGSNCQGPVTPGPTPEPVDVCTTIESSCFNYPSCDSGQRSMKYLCQRELCTLTGEDDICYDGQLWDNNARSCVDKPEPCRDVCTTIQSSCFYYPSCDSGQASTKYLCERERCTLTREKDMCYGGKLWDVNARSCVDTPQPCPADPIPGPSTECVAVESSCEPVDVCTGASRRVQNLCRLERCTRDGQDSFERPMCPNNNFLYDVDQKKCVTPPSENTCRSCEFTKSNCREYDLCNPSGVRRLCDCSGCAPGMLYDPSTKVCIAKTALCPVLECVFRDSVCGCLFSKSLCTGCYMNNSFIPVSQFCTAQANPEFYHVEQDSCLYSNPGFRSASSGHCPRTRDTFIQPSLQCSLRSNSIIRCWSDDMF